MIVLFSITAHAATFLPTYSRSQLSIVRKAPPAAASLPWETPSPESSTVQFNVEVRDGAALYNQQGWFNLSSPSDNEGILMAFATESKPPITPMTQYAPVDILMINHEGTITQIVPNIKLSDLQENIAPAKPILAFLFLKGGLCQKLSINPGDVVEYELFHRPPVVLTQPK